ncbi:hypothetical protein S83_032566, partial [Arachis hypogaea]
YITSDFIHDRHYNLVWNALQIQHLTDFVQTKDDYYPHLVRNVYSTLNYVVPEIDEEGEDFITGQNLLEVLRQMRNGSLQYENLHMDARGYACHWTKIFKWLRIDLSEEKSIALSNVAKIDDSTLTQMGRDPDAQEPQIQGQPQDPDVQAQPQEFPPPPPPSPTMQDLMDELRSIRLYIEGRFAEMRQRQHRQTE